MAAGGRDCLNVWMWQLAAGMLGGSDMAVGGKWAEGF